jgi:hypothetical protein
MHSRHTSYIAHHFSFAHLHRVGRAPVYLFAPPSSSIPRHWGHTTSPLPVYTGWAEHLSTFLLLHLLLPSLITGGTRLLLCPFTRGRQNTCLPFCSTFFFHPLSLGGHDFALAHLHWVGRAPAYLFAPPSSSIPRH